jgi:hypothetical protein
MCSVPAGGEERIPGGLGDLGGQAVSVVGDLELGDLELDLIAGRADGHRHTLDARLAGVADQLVEDLDQRAARDRRGRRLCVALDLDLDLALAQLLDEVGEATARSRSPPWRRRAARRWPSSR